MNPLQFNMSKTVKPFLLFLLLFFGFQLTLSCNGNKKIKNHFKISIDMIAYQNSTIQVFYKLKADDRYYEEFSLKKNVKASASLQKLIFELPFGIKPKNLRIDLGENENDCVRVENMRFRYKNIELNGDHGVYKSWFTFNKNVIEGKDSLTFYMKKVNQFFDPQLNGNRKLNAKLVKLFPPDIYEK
jgi:hypothetical protein